MAAWAFARRGLTLRFYAAFASCKTLPKLAARIAAETPELDRWFIHALVSQTADGALTLGDSHEYGLSVDPFNKQEIDDLILDYTLGFLKAPTWPSPSDGMASTPSILPCRSSRFRPKSASA